MIGQGGMVNTSADVINIMVDDEPTVLPEQGQKIPEHTLQPQPLVPAQRAQTPETRPWPRNPQTHALGALQHWGLVTPQKRRPAVASLSDAESAGNTSDVDVDQVLHGELAGGDSLPDIHLPDAPLPEACADCWEGQEWTSPRVAEVAMVVAIRSGSGSGLVGFLCSNLFISGIDYYTLHEVFG